jgi:V8-like Glu-specific endopeptidase
MTQLLSVDNKCDDGNAHRLHVRGDRFSDSFLMATNGGSSYEDVLRPHRPVAAAPPAHAVLLRRAAPRGGLQNVIGGSDERVPISDTSRIPARSVGLLKILPEDGELRYGTAWLIGPRVLATAAHNLIHPEAGRTKRLDVGLAYDGTNARGGWHQIVDCRFSADWEGAPSPDNPKDYAVLKIEDAAIGNRLGWLGYADYEDEKFQDMVVNLFGYPLDLKQFTMYGAAGRVLSIKAQRIFYDCDAGGGMSGAPVIARFGEHRIAVGIHVAGGMESNAATRITAEAYKLFEQHRTW